MSDDWSKKTAKTKRRTDNSSIASYTDVYKEVYKATVWPETDQHLTTKRYENDLEWARNAVVRVQTDYVWNGCRVPEGTVSKRLEAEEIFKHLYIRAGITNSVELNDRFIANQEVVTVAAKEVHRRLHVPPPPHFRKGYSLE